jgi:hypothetical protein
MYLFEIDWMAPSGARREAGATRVLLPHRDTAVLLIANGPDRNLFGTRKYQSQVACGLS